MERDKACTINEINIDTLKAIYLENNLVRVTILVGKGADIYEITYKPTNINLLLKTKDGIDNLKEINLSKKRLKSYYEHHTGGWQDLLPHRGTYENYEITQEIGGISSTLPWNYIILNNSEDLISIKCFVNIPIMPLYIEKTFTMKKNIATLYIDEKVKNEGKANAQFTWTQHATFGEQFLDENIDIILPECSVFCPYKYNEKKKGELKLYEESINCVTFNSTNKYSLLKMLPKEKKDQVFVVLRNLECAEYMIYNRKKGIGIKVNWDLKTYPYIRYWMNSNEDAYTIGLEPSNDCFVSFESSLQNGTYLMLKPKEEYSTCIECEILNI